MLNVVGEFQSSRYDLSNVCGVPKTDVRKSLFRLEAKNQVHESGSFRGLVERFLPTIRFLLVLRHDVLDEVAQSSFLVRRSRNV